MNMRRPRGARTGWYLLVYPTQPILSNYPGMRGSHDARNPPWTEIFSLEDCSNNGCPLRGKPRTTHVDAGETAMVVS